MGCLGAATTAGAGSVGASCGIRGMTCGGPGRGDSKMFLKIAEEEKNKRERGAEIKVLDR